MMNITLTELKGYVLKQEKINEISKTMEKMLDKIIPEETVIDFAWEYANADRDKKLSMWRRNRNIIDNQKTTIEIILKIVAFNKKTSNLYK